jgi:ABC-type bacteriocin/lantibiotic exporter with double-glycine peptidase domain
MSIPYKDPQASRHMLAQEQDLSCGAACARELLRRQGNVFPEAVIRNAAKYSAGVGGVGGGIFARPLGNALSVFSGHAWYGGPIDADAWQIRGHLKAKAPLIVMLSKHWVIVDGYQGDMLKILDPEPYSGGLFATEGLLDYAQFFGLFRHGRFQVVERR